MKNTTDASYQLVIISFDHKNKKKVGNEILKKKLELKSSKKKVGNKILFYFNYTYKQSK